MSRSDADTIFSRLKWRRAFSNWERSAARWIETIKAGYDPNQPRHPKGSGDGGRWSGGNSKPGIGHNSRRAQNKPTKKPNDSTPRYRPNTRRESPVTKVDPPIPDKPVRSRGPLEPAPDVPQQAPDKFQTRVAKRVGAWLIKAAARRALGPIGLVLDAIDIAFWMKKHIPDMQSSFDPPRSLKELRETVEDPVVGYEVHHIVERGSLGLSDSDKAKLNLRENLARIPTWKHHDINVWMRTRNKEFIVDGKMVSPKEYMKDKSWEVRTRIGLDALKRHGVLKDE